MQRLPGCVLGRDRIGPHLRVDRLLAQKPDYGGIFPHPDTIGIDSLRYVWYRYSLERSFSCSCGEDGGDES